VAWIFKIGSYGYKGSARLMAIDMRIVASTQPKMILFFAKYQKILRQKDCRLIAPIALPVFIKCFQLG